MNREDIVVKLKDTKGLPNVTFVPPKFGLFICVTFFFGFGVGWMVKGSIFGVGIALLSFFAMLYVYMSRENM